MTQRNRHDDLRRLLDGGADLDTALGTLRLQGASWPECIASLRAVRGCSIAEAQQLVQGSPVWADVMNLQGFSPAQPSNGDTTVSSDVQQRLASALVQGMTATERDAARQWVLDLLEIRDGSGPPLVRGSSAVRRTLRDPVVSIPRLQAIEHELGVSAMALPIWIAVGAGRPFANMLLEELARSADEDDDRAKRDGA
jgi:hypothetical protein